jgi:RNA polymerase sigma-70 factor, ECF subfamily
MSTQLPGDPGELDAQLGRAWREHRRYVLDIALRMLGDLGDAEDVVQDAFTRLLRVDTDELDDVRAWLVTVVSRLCLDQLRSARRQRQVATGEPPEGPPFASVGAAGPSAGPGVDPADRVTLDDSVRLALYTVLERLTPAERTTFVLHDVFRLSFDDVADIVGRTPAACRQLASRARRHVQADVTPARFTVESAEQREVVDRFMAACSTGDLDGLLAVLDPDVAGQYDGGGTMGLLPPVVGAIRVATMLMRFLGPESSTTLLSLPTQAGTSVAMFRDDRLVAMTSLTVRDGQVHHIHTVGDPARLADVAASLGARV